MTLMNASTPNRPALATLLGNRAQPSVPQHAAAPARAPLECWLPSGGWPEAALSEVLHAEPGTGELGLALPLVAQLTQRQLPVAFVNPPRVPSAAGLLQRGVSLDQVRVVQPQASAGDQHSESLWTTEQLLRSGYAAVLVWADTASPQALRRLQQTAAETGGRVLLFRSLKRASEFSPAVLRLAVRRETSLDGGSTQVQVLKDRGPLRSRVLPQQQPFSAAPLRQAA